MKDFKWLRYENSKVKSKKFLTEVRKLGQYKYKTFPTKIEVFVSNQELSATTLLSLKLAGIKALRFHDSRYEVLTWLARKLDVLDLRMVGSSNKKFRQRGYSENYTADLIWQSGSVDSKKLDESIDKTKPEAVRYLPQNYFEQLTNEVEIEEFRREIEDVVFSHVEETDRMGKESFEDLQEFKTQPSKQETSLLKAKLRELNIEIVELEEQADPVFKDKPKGELKVKNKELTSLESAKPVEVNKPDKETEEQKNWLNR